MTGRADPGAGTILLLLLLAIVVALVAGCTGASTDHQAGTAPETSRPAVHPAATTAATARITTAPVTVKTTSAAAAPVSSTGVIRLDPVSDRARGEKFTLTGSTSLPAGTALIWQVLPDRGTPPAGLDKGATMSVMGTVPVARGDGAAGRISIPVDLGNLVPGHYVVIAGTMHGSQSAADAAALGGDYGYAYFTVK